MNSKITRLIPVGLAILPLAASAATATDLITTVQGILNALIPLFMVIATVVFLWGVVRYITSAGEDEKVKEAKNFIMYGLIGLFVMVSVWGLVGVLVSTFGVGGGSGGIQPPAVPQ
ncbi:MAG: pilin [Patescibacteria group bacterium]